MTEEQKMRLQGLGALHSWLRAQGLTMSWLATQLGVKRQALSQWRSVPAQHIDSIVSMTGISASTLRPDLAHLAAKYGLRPRSRAA